MGKTKQVNLIEFLHLTPGMSSAKQNLITVRITTTNITGLMDLLALPDCQINADGFPAIAQIAAGQN